MSECYSVVSFAYNEENTVGDTIASILANCDHRLTRLTIVANGCTDRTVEVAKQALKNATTAHSVIELSLGDKCNAWNQYIYHHLPVADVHFFVDSDVTFTKNAFPLLFEKLLKSEGKNAVAGLPLTGRNIKQYEELTKLYSCLFGCLYGLTDDFSRRIVKNKTRLPIGLSWIDAQITKMINDDLKDEKDDYQHRVTFIEGVGYEFESLKPWKVEDIRLYVSRICRYKTGQLQEPYLDALPYSEWPDTMEEINRNILRQGVKLSSLGKITPFRGKVLQNLNKKFTGASGA
ncbi:MULTISPECIES: glycosyltransferase family A protein [unclassified Marinobacter]|jgi:glycosyltransferase involved in cell wall biosynthesis|uniref:glycosyltransferase family A protein n=1 Tax=unclassified Marinobacter TaxID=83889 RepID=UPI0018F1BF7C|nr:MULTISPECIES: glycosyltransferase family A protein [unclassified Marinobacter]|tara:strand:+ start:2476 stop:3345 length:870 start_codon:yes stop_codon:yes gene_type:complete